MEAAGNNDGTLLAILIIGVIILIVSVRLGLLTRLLSKFRKRPVLPSAELYNTNANLGIRTTNNSSMRDEVTTGIIGDNQQSNSLTPERTTPAVNVGVSGGNKVNVKGNVAGRDHGETSRSGLSSSIRSEIAGGVNIAGGTINIGGDVVAGDKIMTLDFTESAPIKCPACGRGYVPAESHYACPNCGTATSKNLIQSS